MRVAALLLLAACSREVPFDSAALTDVTRLSTDPREWLAAGEQTRMPAGWTLPDELRDADAQQIVAYVAGLRQDESDKDRLFRRRTAHEILQSGFATGCTDYALAALPLLRARGIPALYVEGIKRSWLEHPDDPPAGHVFVDAFIDGRWRILNPQRGRFESNYGAFVVVARGADGWSIGLRDRATTDRLFAMVLRRHQAAR